MPDNGNSNYDPVVCIYLVLLILFFLFAAGEILWRLVEKGDFFPLIAFGASVGASIIIGFYSWVDKKFGHRFPTGGYHHLHRSD